MLFDIRGVEIRTKLDAGTIGHWVELGWLSPEGSPERPLFSPTDVARIALIVDLRNEFGVNDEGVGIILDLIDQVHGLRGALSELIGAIHGLPDEVQERIAADASGPPHIRIDVVRYN